MSWWLILLLSVIAYAFLWKVTFTAVLRDAADPGERRKALPSAIFLATFAFVVIVPLVVFDYATGSSPREIRRLHAQAAERKSRLMERKLGEWK